MNQIKKIIITMLLLTFANLAFAGASVVKIGGGLRYNSAGGPTIDNAYTTVENESAAYSFDLDAAKYISFYAQVQHGLPFVPNYRLNNYSFKTKIGSSYASGAEYDIKDMSHELFYGLNFAIIEAQLGIAMHSFTAIDSSEKTYSATGLIANVIIDIPSFPLTPSINLDIGSGDTSVNSMELNFAWNLMPGLYLDFGTKNYTYKYDHLGRVGTDAEGKTIDYTLKNNTTYLGVSFNFGV